jgi:ribosomal protein S12 methylthiotransferase
VDHDVAIERYDRLMLSQAGISYENNKKYINGIYNVLIEEGPVDGHYIGRTSFQAPEVDGVTFIRPGESDKSGKIEKGSFIMVKITEAFEYDLTGVPV